MSRVLIALIALVAVLGVVLWRVAASGAQRSVATPVATSATVESLARERTGELAPPPAPEPSDPPSRSTAREPTRQEASSAERTAELARAQWIEGRVVFPPGTPLDEEVLVTADGRDFEDGRDHRVRVERDGAFRVAFSEKTRSGRLELAGRYLFLRDDVYWKRGAPETAVLEPELGGRIAVRVVGTASTSLVRAGDRVRLHLEQSIGSGQLGDQRERALAADLTTTFDALAPEHEYSLGYEGETLYAPRVSVSVSAGETSTVQLALRPGVVLAGHVVDENGAPVADAQVRCRARPYFGGLRAVKSSADGAFRLGAFAPSEVTLEADREGFETHVLELGRLEEGTTRADLELVLSRGGSISGLVTWPDGTPAEASVQASPRFDQHGWDGAPREQNFVCGPDGRFCITGLAAESYVVRASVLKGEETEVTSKLTGRPRKKNVRERWSAELERVESGTTDLVLILSNGFALSGRVLDELGVPLPDFRVSATRPPELARMPSVDGQKSLSFRDADGFFTLGGLSPGEWRIAASAAGHARSEAVSVTIAATRAAEPIELRVPREARAIGVVLDPSGAPCANAVVSVARPEGEDFLVFDSASTRDHRTDENGAFALERLRPGATVLKASGPEGAPSEPCHVVLVAGQETAGIVLRLRTGARLVGEVFGSDGGPEAGVEVDLFGDASDYDESCVTDDDGRFEVTGLPPGALHVSAMSRDGLHLQQSVEVREGETAHVRLAPPRGSLVRLHGRVLAGDEPLANASVYVHEWNDEGHGDEEGGSSTSSFTESDAEGAYELVLPGAGKYELSLHRGGVVSSFGWSTTLEVPDVSELAYDVEIPLGTVSGRVTGEDGSPLAGVRIESQPGRHEDSAAGGGRTRTDEEGRYELTLSAGIHVISAGAQGWGVDRGQRYVAEHVRDLTVNAKGHVRGIDFVLSSGGTLEGRVRTSASGSADQALIWSDHEREPLGWSRGDGTFHIEGVASGTHWVRATSAGGATKEATRVDVEAGKTAQVELELVPATRVHVRVRDAAGSPLGCDIEALDREGAWVPVQRGRTGEASIGPLLPGRYTVRVQRDGKLVDEALEVSTAEPEQTLELVFE